MDSGEHHPEHPLRNRRLLHLEDRPLGMRGDPCSNLDELQLYALERPERYVHLFQSMVSWKSIP